MSLDTDFGLQSDSSGWQRKISSIIFHGTRLLRMLKSDLHRVVLRETYYNNFSQENTNPNTHTHTKRQFESLNPDKEKYTPSRLRASDTQNWNVSAKWLDNCACTEVKSMRRQMRWWWFRKAAVAQGEVMRCFSRWALWDQRWKVRQYITLMSNTG